MNGPGLFDTLDAPRPAERRLGSPTLETRKATGQQAAAAAVKHADKVFARWLERACALVLMFAEGQAGAFLLEDARAYAAAHKLENPPDGRAWGGVAQLLKRRGEIVPTGFYAPAKSSNGAPKATWIRKRGAA